MAKMTDAEIKAELRDIESRVCRLSMAVMDDLPLLSQQLIYLASLLLEFWKLRGAGNVSAIVHPVATKYFANRVRVLKTELGFLERAFPEFKEIEPD